MSPDKNEQILIGRAKNALMSFFEQRLSVPKIYLDVDWEGEKVDLLAIDRAGVGDVTVAFVVGGIPSLLRLSEGAGWIEQQALEKVQSLDPSGILASGRIPEFHSLPAHFKYLVAISDDANAWEASEMRRNLVEALSRSPQLFAQDGVGRIGYILIDFKAERPSISVPIPAERFRSNRNIYDLADAFAASHKADFEIRETAL